MPNFTLTRRPTMLALYIKCVLPKPGLKKGQVLPEMAAHWPNAHANLSQVASYRAVCGIADEASLPLLYPYVLTSPVQMSLIARRDFPLKPLGVVHVRNHVLQHRPILPGETMEVQSRIAASRVAKQGLEFDIATLIHRDGERVWECLSTYLTRGKFGEPDPAPASSRLPELTAVETETAWQVPANMGRRYARVSGDYNVIHVSNLLARLFGFRGAIIHGMWSAAKCLASLPPWTADGPLSYRVAFKGPIPIGSRVVMKSQSTASGRRFDAFCKDNPRPCICGAVEKVAPGTHLVE